MTNWAQIFTGLLFYGYDGIHQVRRLVFDNYQMVTFPLRQNCQYYQYHNDLYYDITLHLATMIDLQLRSILHVSLCEISPRTAGNPLSCGFESNQAKTADFTKTRISIVE